MTKQLMIENTIKNILVVGIGGLSYFWIDRSLSGLETNMAGDFLFLISILLVTACFANFAFSYEELQSKKMSMRMIEHTSTFVFLLLILLILEAMAIMVQMIYPDLFHFIVVLSVLLYAGMVLFDFWDAFRAILRYRDNG